MSRHAGRPIQVVREGDVPSLLLLGAASLPITAVLSHWREWIGVHEGEPERDNWLVATPHGVCELHCLRFPTEEEPEPAGGNWLLWRWED